MSVFLVYLTAFVVLVVLFLGLLLDDLGASFGSCRVDVMVLEHAECRCIINDLTLPLDPLTSTVGHVSVKWPATYVCDGCWHRCSM